MVAGATSGDKAVPCSKDGKTCTPTARKALCVETKCNAQGQVVLAFKGQKEVVCQKRGKQGVAINASRFGASCQWSLSVVAVHC